jgi:hypothetical protein
MGPFVMAWLVGEGIIIYRTAKKYHVPPSPGQLIWTSGIFVLLALVAESERARGIATLAAWGFDIAAFLNLYEPITNPAPPQADWPPTALPPNVIFPGEVSTQHEAFGSNPAATQ